MNMEQMQQIKKMRNQIDELMLRVKELETKKQRRPKNAVRQSNSEHSRG